ncbi:MAG: MaoC family dehydratase N-terminal domain-containing protein [Dehalococcoidia bacterium]|nr:MaoC family dehydratase N-terminal domain-containing protein [Dehalococcoidia bacterium]
MTLKASDISEGQEFSEVVAENLTRTQIVQYAGSSGDYNPIHTDEVYTKEIAGYPSVFAHGMLSMGATGVAITNLVGDGRLTKYGVRFVNQVWPGDTLTTTLSVESISEEDGQFFVDLVVSTSNQDGREVVRGAATARIDP